MLNKRWTSHSAADSQRATPTHTILYRADFLSISSSCVYRHFRETIWVIQGGNVCKSKEKEREWTFFLSAPLSVRSHLSNDTISPSFQRRQLSMFDMNHTVCVKGGSWSGMRCRQRERRRRGAHFPVSGAVLSSPLPF